MRKVFARPNNRILATTLIAAVFLMNIQAGLEFYFRPQLYAPAFELSGLPGQLAISGFGILFLMWNVPYAFALWNPLKNHAALIQALIMQFIGCIGETSLLVRIPENQYALLHTSILRFIIFDSAGLVLLVIALFLIRNQKTIDRDL